MDPLETLLMHSGELHFTGTETGSTGWDEVSHSRGGENHFIGTERLLSVLVANNNSKLLLGSMIPSYIELQ